MEMWLGGQRACQTIAEDRNSELHNAGKCLVGTVAGSQF